MPHADTRPHYVRIVPNGHIDYLAAQDVIKHERQARLRQQYRDVGMCDIQSPRDALILVAIWLGVTVAGWAAVLGLCYGLWRLGCWIVERVA